MNDIKIITTGGTFDKQYDPIKGELTFRGAQIEKILKDAFSTLSISHIGPLAIDSLFMSEEQREQIVDLIRECEDERIIVIHGTDTMVKTALLAKQKLASSGKTVVFTGAMVPYALENSDAVFNLGMAIASVQLLPSGVFITMGGRIFPADKVFKNREKGIFEGL